MCTLTQLEWEEWFYHSALLDVGNVVTPNGLNSDRGCNTWNIVSCVWMVTTVFTWRTPACVMWKQSAPSIKSWSIRRSAWFYFFKLVSFFILHIVTFVTLSPEQPRASPWTSAGFSLLSSDDGLGQPQLHRTALISSTFLPFGSYRLFSSMLTLKPRRRWGLNVSSEGGGAIF